jgi:hypothetical protein
MLAHRNSSLEAEHLALQQRFTSREQDFSALLSRLDVLESRLTVCLNDPPSFVRRFVKKSSDFEIGAVLAATIGFWCFDFFLPRHRSSQSEFWLQCESDIFYMTARVRRLCADQIAFCWILNLPTVLEVVGFWCESGEPGALTNVSRMGHWRK